MSQSKQGISPKERYDIIIKEAVSKPLRKYGFKKKGTQYVSETESLIRKIKVSKKWYNTKDYIAFFLEWEVWAQPKILNELPFLFRVNLLRGDLSKMANIQNKYMLIIIEVEDLNYQEKDKKTIKYLGDILKKSVPILLAFHTIEDVIKKLNTTADEQVYWETPAQGGQTQDWIACMYYMIGEKEKAIKILDKEIAESQEAKHTAFRENLEKTREQMLSGMKNR